MKAQNVKGFRDFLPEEALRRQSVLKKIVKVFEEFGFDPLETPSLEYKEILMGKYGEAEKLIYSFKTNGGDEVALKYDQTVPLARIIAQYGPKGTQKLPIPFKRYQIQDAYRGENTQKGRYRQFLQCDADIVGIDSFLVDAEILGLVYEIYHELGLEVFIKINDRSLLVEISWEALPALDKLNKIGEVGVIKDLERRGFSKGKATRILSEAKALKVSARLLEVMNCYSQMGYPKESLKFEPTMVRGLDYYTGLIFEVVLKSNPNSASLCGGGRYDQLIGKFTGLDLPAIGFAVGFDRTIEALKELGLLEVKMTNAQVLVTIFSPELINESLEVSSRFRLSNINCELWLDPATKLDKQLKYADQKGIPYAVIVGPEEIKKGEIILKDLATREQEQLSLDELVEKLAQYKV